MSHQSLPRIAAVFNNIDYCRLRQVACPIKVFLELLPSSTTLTAAVFNNIDGHYPIVEIELA
jgi:hypothetical protein